MRSPPCQPPREVLSIAENPLQFHTEPRAGARVLNLLASPLHVRILRALEEGPLRISELRERTERPSQTTLRAAVATFRDLGLIQRLEVSRMPLGVANGLTDAGREALFAAEILERWLSKSPLGPMPIDSRGGKAAIKALAGGWSSAMVRALAEEPVSLTELARQIPEINYPSIERRLLRMRSTRQIEPSPGEGPGRAFAVTEWLRHAVAPLCAAGRCERLYVREDSPPVSPVEIEAAFLLAIPIAPLPPECGGRCVLAMRADGPTALGSRLEGFAGVTVEVDRGQVVSCDAELREDAPTWVLGAPGSWLDAVIDGKLENLQLDGARPKLAADLIQGLHFGLFAS